MKSRVKLGDGARYKPGEDSYVVNVGGRNIGRRKSDIMDEINTLKQVKAKTDRLYQKKLRGGVFPFWEGLLIMTVHVTCS